LRAPCVAACAPSRMSTFFNISDSSLDDTFYPKSVSRKTGAAAPFDAVSRMHTEAAPPQNTSFS
ncbi:MAG: hypothetical protein VB124_01780, partial [Burkholderia sp.]